MATFAVKFRAKEYPAMKTLLLAGSLMFFAVACPLPSAENSTSTDSLVPLTGRMYIERGMHREKVRESLGAPSAMLTPDVWVYFDIRSVNPRGVKVNVTKPQNCDTMLVRFTSDRADVIQF